MSLVTCHVDGGDDIVTTIFMSPDATISELKEQIAERLGVNVSRQQLSCGGMVLHDHRTIEFYNIHDRIDLYVEPEEKKFSITVKSSTDECNIRVKETYTVADLKRKIEKRWGCFATDVTLFRDSLEMEDERPLSAYHVCEGCEVVAEVAIDSR